jgi:hypothetical protein
MADHSSAAAPPDKRQVFRSFMKRFNPTAPAKEGVIGESDLQFLRSFRVPETGSGA